MNERRETLDSAANDPRFDTAWKRLNWFRRPDETDEQFAERLGISLSDLNQWRANGEVPDETIDFYEALGKRLDVCPFWLTTGMRHGTSILPNGGRPVRLTSIPRFKPYYQFVDRPEDNESRSYVECYERQNAAVAR